MTANMNWSRYVTSMIFPMVFIATITHFTTYYKQGKEIGRKKMSRCNIQLPYKESYLDTGFIVGLRVTLRGSYRNLTTKE